MRTHPISEFQRQVFAAVNEIPAGKVASYQMIAKQVNCRSPRAIGQALKTNPDAPHTPCHRVISSSGQIGGYLGSNALTSPKLQKKLKLLAAEGVQFSPKGQLLNTSAHWLHPPATQPTG